ncbi:MAG: TIGR03618 family F420-dependent PPOX class oxidoreductase [Propionibacteriales bacterium]|nr:TIGR03618 family F420-dependent PPOX class oxidoreductase [Propionibacteriales bacterium]
MDIDEALEFVRHHHRAVCVTRRPDGLPATSPVLAGVNGEGHVIVSTRETAYKVSHVRHEPHVALCVFNNAFFGDWVQVEGEAEVVPLPEAMDGLIEYYRGISGDHPDWEEYRAAMVKERRVLLRIDVSRVGPQLTG